MPSDSFAFFSVILFAVVVLLLRASALQEVDGENPASRFRSRSEQCRLNISAELFGGVKVACGGGLDRSRCCPVLAAWLFAAHAQLALRVSSPSLPQQDLPLVPDDPQKCVNSLQAALLRKDVRIPQPNASCDPIMCFCGIRLHQITSLSCPAAFTVDYGSRDAVPTAAVTALERSCRNSSHAGCTKCLTALQKLKSKPDDEGRKGEEERRVRQMFNRDCQLMGLTWLLARNKTAYIATVSAVLRAIMYSTYARHEYQCSSDHENMPLAADTLLYDGVSLSASSSLRQHDDDRILGSSVVTLTLLAHVFSLMAVTSSSNLAMRRPQSL